MEQDDNHSILSNVNKIEDKLKKLEKEKETIQQSCKHQDGFDINFNENKQIKKYCSTCKRDIGFTSTEEQQDFFGTKNKN
jgi:flagellar motility protein MotE (MotC chaperone)